MIEGRLKHWWIAAASALPLAVIGCGPRDLVGTHSFDVPEAHAVPQSAWPFWLPRSDEQGFLFTLNPRAAPPDQVIVGVSSREDVCRRAAASAAYVNDTVCSSRPFRWEGQPRHRTGDGQFWTYVLTESGPATAASRPQVVVSCFAMGGGIPGRCTAIVPFGDLVLTLSMADPEVPRLEPAYRQATGLLQEWEQ